MPITDPFLEQLGSFNANVPNARRALLDLYKLRLTGYQRHYNDVNRLYGQTFNETNRAFQGGIGAVDEAERASQQMARSSLGSTLRLGGAEQAEFDKLINEGNDPFRTRLGTERGLALQGIKGERAGEQKYAKTMMQGLVRERSAAEEELEEGIIDTQTNLFTESNAFQQQQQYNAALQSFYNANVANFGPIGGAGSANGNAVAQAASRYLGVPYRWGGTSPQGFDCSGLVQQVFRDQGINLPRTSREQSAATARVYGGMSAAQAGDLLFWGNPVHHVAIYIGNGQMIAAPHAGATVQVQRVYGTPDVHRV